MSARTALASARDPRRGTTTQPLAPGRRLRIEPGAHCDRRDAVAATLAVVSRSASLEVSGQQGSFWLVLRGSAQVDCHEGQFQLRAGEWIALDRDSRPAVQAGRSALVLALLLPPMSAVPELRGGPVIYPGRGTSTLRGRRLALALWREAGVFASTLDASKPVAASTLRRILHLFSDLQDAFESLLSRCPGRSLRRRRQVLVRMQRARLYLDGHLSRDVRLSELARLTIFSTWYFTKTFHALYDEGPRDVMSRLRLRRAATLLAQTDLSISEVGEACGFENPCSFARAFRACHGMTATAFRCASGRVTPSQAQRTGTNPKLPQPAEP